MSENTKKLAKVIMGLNKVRLNAGYSSDLAKALEQIVMVLGVCVEEIGELKGRVSLLDDDLGDHLLKHEKSEING